MHQSGFVSIIGKPNAGKSTLLNALIGEKMAIATHKAQTTRHRIKGILNADNYQIIFSDTPGIIKPSYAMQEKMMGAVSSALEDADVVLVVVDINEKNEVDLVKEAQKIKVPIAVILNKVDNSNQEKLEKAVNKWQELLKPKAIIPISATKNFNLNAVLAFILQNIPEHPGYYDKEELSDRHLRFFVSEIIREKIFLNYHEEVPYSTEVFITQYKEEDTIHRIHAEIITERESQKVILLGSGGLMLKKIGTQARKEIETFVGQKVFLELFIKVVPDWRSQEKYLKSLGYEQ